MAPVPDRFAHFAAIDWSGAVGERHRGIAVAICAPGHAAPALVRPGHIWSRAEIAGWLATGLPADTLVGIDIGTALPFVDQGAYFPGWPDSPVDAYALWALVEALCADDPHLAANSFVDHREIARHFRRHGGRQGEHFTGQGRLRVADTAQSALGLRPVSNLNLVGAAQVGKASLTGMRVLHRLRGALPVWPIDPLPPTGSAIVEIYTSLAAQAAGRRPGRSKMRTIADLNTALAALGSAPVADTGAIDDHKSDALLTAAWLRTTAHRHDLWHPAALTPQIARTEGWTFGVP